MNTWALFCLWWCRNIHFFIPTFLHSKWTGKVGKSWDFLFNLVLIKWVDKFLFYVHDGVVSHEMTILPYQCLSCTVSLCFDTKSTVDDFYVFALFCSSVLVFLSYMQATTHSCILAKHRKSSTLESKDLLLHLGLFYFQPTQEEKYLHISNRCLLYNVD